MRTRLDTHAWLWWVSQGPQHSALRACSYGVVDVTPAPGQVEIIRGSKRLNVEELLGRNRGVEDLLWSDL